jgi:hypothetical protein
MRLRDLRPDLEGSLQSGILNFDCPLGHSHKIRIPLGEGGWQAVGEFPESLTVTPSINCDQSPSCGWHGTVSNGDATCAP